MNNIFEITNNFDFNKIKLGVPNILNHGNHFSKITNNLLIKKLSLKKLYMYNYHNVIANQVL